VSEEVEGEAAAIGFKVEGEKGLRIALEAGRGSGVVRGA
jgi:hypothetical protein